MFLNSLEMLHRERMDIFFEFRLINYKKIHFSFFDWKPLNMQCLKIEKKTKTCNCMHEVDFYQRVHTIR